MVGVPGGGGGGAGGGWGEGRGWKVEVAIAGQQLFTIHQQDYTCTVQQAYICTCTSVLAYAPKSTH